MNTSGWKRRLILLTVVMLLGSFYGCQEQQDDPFAPLSNQQLEQINEVWQERMGHKLTIGTDRYVHTQHYGTFGDCTVLFQPGSLMVLSSIKVAEHEFTFPSSFTIYVYHDGELLSLQEAFSAGLLTSRQIGLIAEYHKSIDEVSA